MLIVWLGLGLDQQQGLVADLAHGLASALLYVGLVLVQVRFCFVSGSSGANIKITSERLVADLAHGLEAGASALGRFGFAPGQVTRQGPM